MIEEDGSLEHARREIDARPRSIDEERDWQECSIVGEFAQHPGEYHTSKRLARDHDDVPPVEMAAPDDPQFDVYADARRRARKQRRLMARYLGEPRAMHNPSEDRAPIRLQPDLGLLDGIDFGPLDKAPTETEPPSAEELRDALDRTA